MSFFESDKHGTGNMLNLSILMMHLFANVAMICLSNDVQVAFYSTVGVTLFVAFILLLGILLYARQKRLLFISYSV